MKALTVLAATGTDPVDDVSVIGFPDATLNANSNRPDPDQLTGTLLPSSGVPGRISLDVSTSTPDDHPLWQGLSGAAVREAVTGRLFAIVAQAVPDRAARRLYASPPPDPDTDPGLGGGTRAGRGRAGSRRPLRPRGEAIPHQLRPGLEAVAGGPGATAG